MKGLDELYAFKTVVDCGGISAAARRLGTPKSTLARRMNDLEARLGVQLFHRGPRRFVLTNFGRECYAQCARLTREADKVFAMADRTAAMPAGALHVICPPLLGAMVIERLAAEFAITAPRVRLHLEETAAILDPRLVSADLVIYGTFEPLPDLDLIARRIFSSPYVLAAHPRLFENSAPPSAPEELRDLDALGFGPKSTRWFWRLRRGRDSMVANYEPRFTTTQLSAIVEAARQGLGIASLPLAMIEEDLRDGRLVRVLEDWEPTAATVYAIYPSRRTLTMAAERFLDLIVERLPVVVSARTSPADRAGRS